MNRGFRVVCKGGVLVVILIAALLAQGCMGQAVGSQEEEDQPEPAIPVEASKVSNDDVAAVYSGTASLEADEQATVVSQITGVVLEILAEEGDFVEAGAVLARVETDRYRLQVEKANAALRAQGDLADGLGHPSRPRSNT